jgi:uncharacterized protein (TIGR02271 family)
VITREQVRGLLGHGGGVVVDRNGDRIGKVGQVYLNDRSSTPEWVTVKTGLFGTSESFVPLADSTLDGDQIHVPYGKDEVKDAPRVDSNGHLGPDDEADLYRHYGLGYSSDDADEAAAPRGDDALADDSLTRADVGTRGADAGGDTSGPTTDDAMTRSEERLRVGTERVQVGRARLRKYVVTEDEALTVPVEREELRVTRRPVTAADLASWSDDSPLGEEMHEIVLTEERVEAAKEVVPVERVRLGTAAVTEQQPVTETLRKEQVELDTTEVDRFRDSR